MLVEEYRAVTEISLRELRRIWRRLGRHSVLVGGWASHFLVDPEFYRWKRVHYVGSKDIDIGLSRRDLKTAVRELERLGYSRSGFRFYRIFDRDRGRPVRETEGRRRPLFELFYVYVDLVLDKRAPGEVFLWDPLLGFCLSRGLVESRRGFRILQAEPLVLMKLRHLGERDPEKRVKDVMDALLTVGLAGFDTRLFSELRDLFPLDVGLVRRMLGLADDELSALALTSDEITGLKTALLSVLRS
jgi:hypothetical protein